MAIAPPRPCPKNCGRLTRGAGPCAACRQKQDAARGTAAERGYGGDWPEYSRAWLARFPWCGQRRDGRFYADHSRCTARGTRTRASCTDHIVALRDGGARFDPANHQSLCTSCNTAKDARRGGAGAR